MIGFPLTETRYKSGCIREKKIKMADPCALLYGHQKGIGWRFVIRQRGFALVGPTFCTKEQLLNALPAYADSWGL